MEIVDFIIGAVLVLYIVRLLLRMFSRMLLNGLVNKAQQTGSRNYQQSTSRPADGRVKVDFAPKTKSQIPDSEGDFIDYEEIK